VCRGESANLGIISTSNGDYIPLSRNDCARSDKIPDFRSPQNILEFVGRINRSEGKPEDNIPEDYSLFYLKGKIFMIEKI
jgi:hypothetical protein